MKKKPQVPVQPQRLSPWPAPSAVHDAVQELLDEIAPGMRARARYVLEDLATELAQYKPLEDVREQIQMIYEAMAENWGN